jgi:DNA mismatch repair protein MutS2
LFLSHRIEEKEVIPLDIELNKKNRILLISGPNAGGKSVCLKTVGLIQYMLQCGFLVPMSENSEVCLFKNIFLDIGDEQSLENDLSTYSSHLLNMKQFVRSADEHTLFLVDEFGSGTEPALGGAIAEAILEELNMKGAFGVITTHYANLKHFASETPGIINGAMLFDTQQIKPLFKLSIGKPGSSFAIDIARNIGLSEHILKRASEKVGDQYVNYEKHLREILRDKKYWEEKRLRIRNVERILDNLYLKYSTELEDVQKERKKIIQEAREEASNLIREANKNIERTIREIKESNAEKEKTRDAREHLRKFKAALNDEGAYTDGFDEKLKELHRAGQRLAQHSPELSESKVNENKKKKEQKLDFKAGDTVRLIGLDTTGEILEVNDKTLLVAFGNMITSVEHNKVEHADPDSIKKSGNRESVFTGDIAQRKLKFRPEIDVRGMRGDEALSRVQELIDDAVLTGVRNLKVLHGKGNGILRQLIREYLSTVDCIKSINDEHADRGGAGITLIELEL